ncbi:MAG: helix-turn-helix transcriptional regulator [Polyangiaceae bacterium]
MSICHTHGMGSVRIDERKAVNVLEAAHAGHEGTVAWLDDLIAQMRSFAPGAGLYTACIVQRTVDHWRLVAGDTASAGIGPLAGFGDALPSVPPEALDPYYRNPRHAFTHRGVRRAFPEAIAVGDGFLEMFGMTDSVTMLAQAGNGLSMVLFGMSPATIPVEPSGRRLLTRVAAHVEAILRVRVEGAAPVAVLGVDGRLRDAEPPVARPSSQEKLRHHVRTIEGSRRRAARERRGAIDAWSALVSGRFALVEDVSGPRREYHVYENPAHVWRSRALSPREASVLELSARGLSGKLVGYTLGLSFTSVSDALGSAATKTGCGSRNAVVRLASTALGPAAPAFEPAKLTPAERQIVARLAEGWTNAAIAKERGTSPSTVKNQIGALLHKFGTSSRRALAAGLGAASPLGDGRAARRS